MATKKRLIDANALMERLKFKRKISEVGLYRGLESAMAQCAKAPTVDAVEVVRCKDCEYTCPGTSGIVCTMWGAGTEPDGWCYKAERKDNG